MTSVATEHTSLLPLENRTFLSIFPASQLSSLGWLMQTMAFSWLRATVSTSDLMVALVQASSTLPAFFLAASTRFAVLGQLLAGLSSPALAPLGHLRPDRA